MRLGFIGTGAITEAIVTGMLRAGRDPGRIVCSRRNEAVSARLAGLSPLVEVADDNQEIVDGCDVLFLAIRPQAAKAVLAGLDIPSGKQIVSLIAATPVETVRGWTGTQAAITRAIPLPSVAELNGVTAIHPPSEFLGGLFSSLGSVIQARSLEEFNTYAVASALMGTHFAFLDAASAWMARSGADRAQAQAYLAELFFGLASTARDGRSFEELRRAHTTPGGLNHRACEVFREMGGLAAVEGALTQTLEMVETQGLASD